MKKMLFSISIIYIVSSIAIGKDQTNYVREINLRNKKIDSLMKDFKDAQQQISKIKKFLAITDANILSIFNLSELEKKEYSYDRDDRKGIQAQKWIGKQDELIQCIEENLGIIQKEIILLIHYASTLDIKIERNNVESTKPLKTVFKSPFDPRWQNDNYVNPEWQYDCSVGAIADVYKIKIFQIQTNEIALVEVQYKPPYREVLLKFVDVSSNISVPSTAMVPQNRNTPKNLTYYGGMQGANHNIVDRAKNFEGEWKIMLFKGFNLSQYTDGELVEINKRCIITGVDTYKTALGSNTVFVAEPFAVNLK